MPLSVFLNDGKQKEWRRRVTKCNPRHAVHIWFAIHWSVPPQKSVSVLALTLKFDLQEHLLDVTHEIDWMTSEPN